MSGHIHAPIAPARTACGGELQATVSRIVWQGDEGGPVILRDAFDKPIRCQSGAGEIEEGRTYRFFGAYQEDARWGRQYVASAFLPDAGTDFRGISRYLTSICTGVGEAMVRKLFEISGHAAVRHLRETPQEVEEARVWPPGLALSAAAELAEKNKFEQATIDLFGLFAGYSLGAVAIKACLDIWGQRAPRVIARNPWQLLLRDIPGASFKRVHRMYLDRGGQPKDLKIQALAGWHALHEAPTGSTWHPLGLFHGGVVEQIGRDGVRIEDALQLAARSGLVEASRRFEPDKWLATPQQATAERVLALAVERLTSGSESRWPEVSAPTVSEHQAERWNAVHGSRLVLLTGAPGCGKTYLASRIAKAVQNMVGSDMIAVCAPTNKAAGRIAELMLAAGVRIEAATIHRLLGPDRNGHDGKGWTFRHGPSNPLDVRYLVVDEVSMCDTSILSALLAALHPACHVLLIGDDGQLPPVGEGAPLRDLLAACVPHAHLTEIKRNSGLITKGCEAVRAGHLPETCERFDLPAGANLKLIDAKTDVQQRKVIADLLYALMAKPNCNAREDCQVLVARNDDGCASRRPLNDFLQNLLNPVRDADIKAKSDVFRLRDKVIARETKLHKAMKLTAGRDINRVENWQERPGTLLEPAQCIVAKGEMGVVVAVSTEKPKVLIRLDAPLRYVVHYAKQRSKKEDGKTVAPNDDFELGYAITTHYSQGSEWPYVIVAIDAGGDRVASREWVYTAISRAREWCTLIGNRAVLAKQVRRAELPGRKTFLRELIEAERRGRPAPAVALPPAWPAEDAGVIDWVATLW